MSRLRESVTFFEIDVPRCERTYGVAPCAAVLGTTGTAKCYNSRKTCQDPANLLLSETVTLRFSRDQEGILRYGPLIPAITADPSTTALAVNLAGMEKSVSALGRRESVTTRLRDFQYADTQLDKYRLERETGEAQAPADSGTAQNGAGLRFNDITARLNSGAAPAGMTSTQSAVSVVMRFRIRTFTPDAAYWSVRQHWVANGWMLAVTPGTKKIQWNLGDSGSVQHRVDSDAALNADQVYCAIGTYDGATSKLYMDGVQQAGTYSGTMTFNGTTQISHGWVGGTAAPDGTLDEILVYNRALTAAEVVGINAGRRVSDGLVLHWLVDEGTGTSVTDASGNGNTGTVSGATSWVNTLAYNTLRLRSLASAVQDAYAGMMVRLADGRAKKCLYYNGTTKVAVVDGSWSTNYLLYSEDQTQAAWSKTQVSASLDGTVSPSGKVAALIAPTGVAASYVIQSSVGIKAGDSCSYEGEFKAAGTGRYVRFEFHATRYSGGGVIFDLQTGTKSGGLSSDTIASLGGGWYRCKATRTALIDSPSNAIFPTNGSVGVVGENIYVAGLREGITGQDSDYIETTSARITLPDSSDTYTVSEAYKPHERGTFWGKFLARHPYYTSFNCRIREGYIGDALADMRVRNYVVDSIAGPNNGEATVKAKDLFSLIERRKAVAPPASSAVLAADITVGGTSATLSPAGIGDSEFGPLETLMGTPGAGYVTMGDEICSYTRAADVLTLARAQKNTEAASHDAEATVQWNLVITSQTPQAIIALLLENFSEVPVSAIDLPAWNAAVPSVTGVFSGHIAKPEPVADLIGELEEHAGLTVWPDVATNSVQLRALRAAPALAVLDDEKWILPAGFTHSREEQKRVSQVVVHYAQRNPLDSLTEQKNYATHLIVPTDGASLYGTEAVREVFSRWIPSNGRTLAQAAGLRIAAMFKDPPLAASIKTRTEKVTAAGLEIAAYVDLEADELQEADGSQRRVTCAIVSVKGNEEETALELQGLSFGDEDDGVRRIFIDEDAADVNLRTLHDALFPPPVGTEVIEVTVSPTVKMSASSTAKFALVTGDWPAGVTLSAQIDGEALGRGGNGAQGGSGNASGNVSNSFVTAGANGEPGGPAFKATYPITVKGSGAIRGGGGGGGGGGGAAIQNATTRVASKGSGGGAGRGGGAGGQPGLTVGGHIVAYGNAGASTTYITAQGAGGASTSAYESYLDIPSVSTDESTANGGKGGDGGDWGMPGQSGDNASTSYTYNFSGGTPDFNGAAAGGTGGAPGKAIEGNSFITWDPSNTITINGAVT